MPLNQEIVVVIPVNRSKMSASDVKFLTAWMAEVARRCTRVAIQCGVVPAEVAK